MILGAQKLRFERFATWLEHRRGLAVSAACLLWMLPGLFGRDPWKPEEAYIFGVVYDMLVNGQWLVPTLAGETFLRHPPFYHWTAAAAASVLSPALLLHDAARAINLVYGGITFAALSATVSRLYSPNKAWLAPLVLLGCVGIVQPAHLLVPDNALLAAYALSACGLAASGQARPAAALALGCGIGMAFLSRGIFSALPLVATVVLLPWISPAVRGPHFRQFAALVALVALPWLCLWPLALFLEDPAIFGQWLWIHQFGRFWSDLPDGGHGSPAYYLTVLPWFAWPAIPFALWTIWSGRRDLRSDPGLAIPLVLFLTTLATLSLSHDKRELYALPLLVPLSLLCIARIPELRRGAINVFFWFGIAFFLFFLAVAWFYFSAVEFGVPARAARHMAAMEPGYLPDVSPVAMLAAAAAGTAWLLMLFNIRRSPERPFVTWAAGAIAFWVTLMLLMIGWVDNAKTYRPVVEALSSRLGPDHGCIASLGLGDSQRALLHYFGGIQTLRVESGHRPDTCRLLLVEGTRDSGEMDSPWELVWVGHRAGDNRERYRLYELARVPGRP